MLQIIIIILMHVRKIIKLLILFVITISISISLSFDGDSNAFELLLTAYYYHLDFLQLYEDCFNGIDDDGDRLIDRQDVFDC